MAEIEPIHILENTAREAVFLFRPSVMSPCMSPVAVLSALSRTFTKSWPVSCIAEGWRAWERRSDDIVEYPMDADFERLLVPGCTELPACRCGKEMRIARTYSLSESTKTHIRSMIALRVTMNCGLPPGVPSKR